MSAGLPTPSRIGPTSGPIAARLGAALTLRRDFYARAAAEKVATGPAGAVVCLSALARESVVIYEISQVWRAWSVIIPILVVLSLLAWLMIGAVAWLTTRFVRSPPDFRRLLRCLGFAQTPTMLLATLASMSDPTLYLMVFAALMLWAFAAVVVALRAATEQPTASAALLAIPVFLTQFVVLALLHTVVLG